MKTPQELIDEIMDWYDFDKVHTMMEAVDWQWGLDGGAGIPEVGEIRQSARKLLNETVNHKDRTRGTGGFEVRAYWEDDKLYNLSLQFGPQWDVEAE